MTTLFDRKLLAAALSAAAIVWAPLALADFAQGADAYRDGDYAAARKVWQPLAEKGNAQAQYALGMLYADGEGVDADQTTATRWYRKAAQQGLANAEHNLAVRYEQGRGVPRDLDKAVYWYRKAAAQGQHTAQNNLGLLYAQGKGVDKDPVQATRLIAAAARAGSAPAKKNMPRLLAQFPARQVGGRNVNIRADATTDAKVLLQAREGAQVRVLNTRGDWSEVVFPASNLVGWVATRLLAGSGGAQPVAAQSQSQDDVTGKRMQVAGSNVNVRAAPNTHARVVMQADEGMNVQVLKTRGDWTRVVFEDSRTIGWVANFLLRAP